MTDFYLPLSSNFTRWVVENGYLETDFVVLDIGVQGGHNPRWDILGPRLSVYGFDPIAEEIETLRHANPNHHYFDMAVGDEDGQRTLFVTETLWTSSFYKPPPQRNKRLGGSDSTIEEREVVTKRIDTLVAEGIIPQPDFIKMDVEGHEPKVIDGARQQLGSGRVLAVESESGFTAHPDAPLSHFALISEPLHELGYYLYNIGLLHATKPALAAGRPRITPELDIYFSPIGRPQTIDVLFSRDGVMEDWASISKSHVNDRLLKMAIILELYNLNDCAIELLQHIAANPLHRNNLRFPVREAIDKLVPTIEGNRFIGDLTGDLGLDLDMDYETYRRLNEMTAKRQNPKITVTDNSSVRLIDARGNILPSEPDRQGSEAAEKESSENKVQFPDHREFQRNTISTKARPAIFDKLEKLSKRFPFSEFRRHLVLPNGITVRRARKGVGWLDSAIIGSGIVKLSGWALDKKLARPVDRIHIFADGRHVETCSLSIDRPDVVDAIGTPNVTKSGFDIILQKRILGEIIGVTIRVFGDSSAGTFELRYPDDYPFLKDDDPNRLNLRTSSFVDRLLAAEDRRRKEVESKDLLRPRGIVIEPHDTLRRLDGHVPTFTDSSLKTEMPPHRLRRENPAVFITFGQSNAANHGSEKYSPKNEFYNLDFVTGKVYLATDPLLGASGDLGNVATRMADKLIDKKIFNSIVLAPLALGGSTIDEWAPGGFAHRRLLVAIHRIRNLGFNPTHFLWHQGESDVVAETSQASYEYAFRCIVESLRDHGAYAPIFVAVASRCGNEGSAEIRAAQRALPNPHHHIFPGPDTDKLGDDYRFDNCHFSGRGLDAHADLWVEALTNPRFTHY